MKKLTLSVVVAFTIGLLPALANGPAEKSEYTFKSTDNEVAMEVQRINGDVKLQMYVRDMSKYDHIIIEKSAETPNYFGKCKYISCADAVVKNGKMTEVDKYPYSALKDVYYRIKTVTKDGVERAYPPVLLASTAQ